MTKVPRIKTEKRRKQLMVNGKGVLYTLRVKETIYKKLIKLSKKTNLSRAAVINLGLKKILTDEQFLSTLGD
jgi:hypothetical protein